MTRRTLPILAAALLIAALGAGLATLTLPRRDARPDNERAPLRESAATRLDVSVTGKRRRVSICAHTLFDALPARGRNGATS